MEGTVSATVRPVGGRPSTTDSSGGAAAGPGSRVVTSATSTGTRGPAVASRTCCGRVGRSPVVRPVLPVRFRVRVRVLTRHPHGVSEWNSTGTFGAVFGTCIATYRPHSIRSRVRHTGAPCYAWYPYRRLLSLCTHFGSRARSCGWTTSTTRVDTVFGSPWSRGWSGPWTRASGVGVE